MVTLPVQSGKVGQMGKTTSPTRSPTSFPTEFPTYYTTEAPLLCLEENDYIRLALEANFIATKVS
jgi:hypothetical protein